MKVCARTSEQAYALEAANDNSTKDDKPKPSARAETSESLIDCTIEACSEGERRVLALARLVEVTPSVFLLFPYYLREISGQNIRWSDPESGMSIKTLKPVTNLNEAADILKWWATYTAATNVSLKR